MVEHHSLLRTLRRDELLDELCHRLERRSAPRAGLGDASRVLQGFRKCARPMRAPVGRPDVYDRHERQVDVEVLARILCDGSQRQLERTMEGRAMNAWTRSDRPSTVPRPEDASDDPPTDLAPEFSLALEPLIDFDSMLTKGSATDLARLAHRILPTPGTRFVLGTAEVFSGSPRTGLVILGEIASRACAPQVRRCAWQNAAIAAWKVGHLEEALEYIARATRDDEAAPAMWVDRLALSVRAEDDRRIARAAAGFDEVLGANAKAYAEGVRATQLVLRTQDGRPTSGILAVAERHANRLSGPAGSFLRETFGATKRE